MRYPSANVTQFAIAACLLFFSCQKQYNVQLDQSSQLVTTSLLTSNSVILQGNIYDEKGQPVPGATATVGKQTVITDQQGYFRMDKAPINGFAPMVMVEKAGYFK